ncbi:MAG: CSLREA domain-containing protein, partial [bacterium]
MKSVFFRTSTLRAFAVVLALLITTAVIARFGVSASSRASAGGPANAITVRAAKRGNPRMNLQDGHAVVANYKNAATREASTAVNGARPLSLATGDLNVDGFPDLLCGYTSESGSFVTVSLGNPEAFGPTRRETIDAVSSGNFHDSFLPDATVIPVPVAPDFLAVGDFDRDGRLDILMATRGNDTIYIAEGKEAGGFSEPQALHLNGAVTALATGQTDNALAEVAVGVSGYEGSQVLVYASKESLLTSTPVSYSVPAMATDISLGQLDDSSPMDLAVASGNEVLVVHDAGQGTSNPKSAIEPISFGAVVSAVTMGDFIADRRNQNELAALSNDGALHVLSHGQLDTRLFTEKEMFERRKELAALREEGNFGTVAPQPWRPSNSKSQTWTEVKSFAGSGSLWNSGSSQRLLTAAKVATGPGEQLMMLDTANNQVQIVMNDQPEQSLAPTTDTPVPTNLVSVELPVEGVPVAALSMRLSVMALPGLVVLSSNQSAPAILPNAPMTTFPVTKATDTNDGACNADCSLREAVVAANTVAGADIITFNAGINPTLTLTSGGAGENNAASGDLDINSSITITGNAPTTISTTYTSACGDCKVFGINQTGGFTSLAVSFSGVTIQNGFNAGTSVCGTFFETGGGIDFFLTGTGNVFSMTNSTVQNNQTTLCAASHGGGVNVDSANSATVGGPSAGTVTFTSCTFTKNSSLHEGGGVNLAADKHDATLTNCTVGGPLATDLNQTTDTTSTSSAGGGVDVEHSFGGTVTISGGSIQNNKAVSGGGLVIRSNENASISNVNISNNTSTGAAGQGSAAGGVAIVELGVFGFTPTITLSGCTISNNHADVNNGQVPVGGGVYFVSPYSATVSNCTISGNTSARGAGVFNGGSSATPAAILTINSGTTISSNVATGPGGGVANADSTGSSTTLNGITIDSNTSGSGGTGIDQTLDAGGTGSLMTLQGTINLNGGNGIYVGRGTFTSTAGTLNLSGNFTRDAGTTFNNSSGTFNFNGSGAQNINGTATSEAFNIFTVNKGGGTLTVGGSTTSLTMSGLVTLTAGTFAAGTATSIGLTTGDWTNNGGTFTPNSSVVSFTNTGGAQAINGSAATQTFNSITVAKTAQTLSVGGSTTTLNLNANMLLTSGTFAAGTASAINVGGDWTNNGGTFTPGSGLVTFNGGAAQNLNGTAVTQTFNNFAVNKGGGTLTGGGSTTTLTINGGVTLTAGTFAAGTITNIGLPGDWSNNGGTFTPGTSTVTFNNTAAAQNINGSAATQTFNSITVA